MKRRNKDDERYNKDKNEMEIKGNEIRFKFWNGYTRTDK